MDSRFHQCSICEKSFSRPSKLQYHIAYHHEKKFSFECTECGKPYSNQDHVNRHYRTKHQLEKSSRFSCKIDECTKTFVNKQNLDRHQRIAHTKVKPKPVKCFYCSEFVDLLEPHLIAKHHSTSMEKFKCLDCSKEFSSVKRLIHHRIIHTGLGHPLAFARFIRLVKGWVTTFEDHERREIDVQWTMNRLLDEIERREVFQCDLCNRIFRSLYQLDQHRNSKIHQNEFLCQYPNCKKTFLYMRNLRHHHRIHHEGISRLSCPMNSCPKTFTCQASICRHLSKCHSQTDIIKQINLKQKQSNCRKLNIQTLLSGFNSRKLHQENELAQQMKSLLKLLLTDDNLIQISEDNMDTNSNENVLNPDILKGYNDIGLVEL